MAQRKTSCRHQKLRGNTLLEFVLVGIPLLFILFSIAELARGMWNYHSVAYAVKKGVRFAIVHGQSCANASLACPVTVGQVAQVIQQSGTGLDSDAFNVTLGSASASQICNPLSSCLTNGSAWPASPDNGIGMTLTITGSYPFASALAMFWPGAGGVQFGVFNLSGSSREEIRF